MKIKRQDGKIKIIQFTWQILCVHVCVHIYECMCVLMYSVNHSVVSDSLQPHGSTIHGILQAKILEWVAISFSRGSS